MHKTKIAEQMKVLGGIESFTKTDTEYYITYKTKEFGKLSILNGHVFRYYVTPNGVFLNCPISNNVNVATINSKSVNDYGKEAFDNSYVKENDEHFIVETNEIKIFINKADGKFAVEDKRIKKCVLKEQEPLRYNDNKTTQTLHQHDDEHFFGGGMQNGRFTHKAEIIHIMNSNNWVDGGVTSPSPFYWSTRGYGVMRHTWQPGLYDFGSQNSKTIETTHKEDHLDAFYFISHLPQHVLSDYYELTGNPIFMPEYAFYEAHLNTFNRDYWVEVGPQEKHAICFEDGKYYKRYQPREMVDKKGILESLNGEKNNYQFSARAMIDRYKTNDVPLGWMIPNDGYGSGYGQTNSLEGDIENLKEFIGYANDNGVEVALWTESRLEPEDPKHPKKGERDLSKEVGVGVVALKCDVAWIGEGYSVGLNAVKHATSMFLGRVKNKVRPLIIMVDGWAGTQRYSGIWSGDQTGGKWEYIRFHIPTYIGAGLSGLPVVGSDMDGIYGGGDQEVNIRDYQWKTFTPLQLNMDGWGNLPKTPFSFEPEAVDINRAYLKLKSMLHPYNYTIGHESVNGLPMVRAMFLEFPKDEPAYTKDSQYQFMWGPSLLVAPVYNKEQSIDDQPIRNEVFLPDPEQVWIDFFTGKKYQGGKVYNNIKAPLWKIPVFVKDGAIIPFVNDNNNPNEIKRDYRMFNFYPNGETSFEIYEDDGKSSDYLHGHYATTKVHVNGPKTNETGDLHIHIHKTNGKYNNMVKERATILRTMAAEWIKKIKVNINGKSINIEKVKNKSEFETKHNVYYFDQKFVANPYLKDFGGEEITQRFLLLKIQETNVTETEIQIQIKGFSNKDKDIFGSNNILIKDLKAPVCFTAFDDKITPTSITLQWNCNEHAKYYEIERDGVLFSNILGTAFAFRDFKYETEHKFRIRSVNDKGVSKWSYYIIVETKEDPHKNTVQGVTVTCNIPCQPSQEVCKLTELNRSSIWHTDWCKPRQADTVKGKVIVLSFDLEDVYEIEKIEYVPREDAGNGTFLKIQYRYSDDGQNWSDASPAISWKQDNNTKTIAMGSGVKMRFLELNVLESVGGFGSGRNVFFYMKN